MSYRFGLVALSELLIVTKDGERGFHACARGVRSEQLRTLFTRFANRYRASAVELRVLLDRIGGDPGIRCVIPGAATRGWVNVEAALALNDDSALVDECERGEDHALEVYRNALDDHLPEFIRRVILRQFESVMNDRHQMRALACELCAGAGIVPNYGEHAARQ